MARQGRRRRREGGAVNETRKSYLRQTAFQLPISRSVFFTDFQTDNPP
jgi:hypothetical protein